MPGIHSFRLYPWLLVMLLGIVGLSTRVSAQCETALQDYQVALQSHQDGLLDPALAGFEAYLRQCPEGVRAPQAHYLMAEILFQQNRCPESFTHAQAVIKHTPVVALRPQALLLGAQCALQLDRLDVAQSYLPQILDAQITAEVREAALYWSGDLAMRQQRYDDAQRYYQQVIQKSRSGNYAPYAYYALGNLARQRGDMSAALDAFTTLLQSAPDHVLAPQARFQRAMLWRDTDRVTEAAAAFRQLAEDTPVEIQEEALFWWAEMAYQLKHYDDATTAYRRLLTAYPQSVRVPESLYGLGWTAVQQQQCEAAVQSWETLLQRAPAFQQAVEVHYQLGLCYIQLNRDAMARMHLQVVTTADATASQQQDAVFKLASLAFRDQDYTQAVQYCTRALTSAKPDEAMRLHYLLGESYAALGEETQAITHWQQILAGPTALPFYAATLYRLGNAYVAQKAWPQAIVVLRQLWETFPQFPERLQAERVLAQAYSNANQCLEALPLYEELRQTRQPTADDHVIFKAYVACLFRLERYPEVVAQVAPLLHRDTQPGLDAPLLYMLGQAYMQLQQVSAALEPFTLLQQHFPDSPLVTAMAPRFAFALEQKKQDADALAVWQTYFQRATLADGPERSRLQLHVGRLAVQQEQWETALTVLAPARSAEASSIAAEALFWSGEVYLRQQRWELAQQVYQELLDRYPEEIHWVALTRLRLGAIYEQQQEWEQALQAYHTVLEATTEAEVVATARQRIMAIEAGRETPQRSPAMPSEG